MSCANISTGGSRDANWIVDVKLLQIYVVSGRGIINFIEIRSS